MTYYKVYDDSGFIGVGTTNDLRKHQQKHNILEFADGSSAQFISISNKLYHDKWMKKPTGDLIEWMTANVVAVDKEEYQSLKNAVENGMEISILEDAEVAEELHEDLPEFEDTEVSVDYVRSVKVRELSLACNQAITAGFDIQINGIRMHFSMTAKDQLNLQDAAIQIFNGGATIPYHADGGEFRLFEADDMVSIIKAANDHKTYHLAYFSALKKWVNVLKRISTIQAIEYGAEIPSRYQTAFLKSLTAG